MRLLLGCQPISSAGLIHTNIGIRTMSKVKESLEANMDFIRSQLPDELKKDAEKCLDNCEVELDDIEIAKQQVMHSLPDEHKEGVDSKSIFPSLEPKPTKSEQKSMVLDALPEEFHADFEKNAENELAQD